jgi:hypothetical protein
MLRNLKTFLLLALAALVWTATPAYSSISTFSNLADWQAAASGVQVIDFSGLNSPGPITDYSTGVGLTVSNIQFIGLTASGAASLQVLDTSQFSWDNYGSGDALMQSMNRAGSDPSPHIHVVFLTPVTAFGTDLFTATPHALSFAISLFGTQYAAPTLDQPNRAFWGVTSDTPISYVDFTIPDATWNGNTVAFLDNFRFGTAQGTEEPPADTPEAATLLLIGSGLVGLASLRKRIKPEGVA